MTEIDQPAPAIDLPTDGGGRVSLADIKGRTIVLFFYPKADTSTCTTENQDFSALAPEFEAGGAVLVGVSRDPVRKLDRFKSKHQLNLVLASDEDGVACEAYGTWIEKTLYGRKYMGVERATFLIDREGVLRHVWRAVRTKGHAAEALEAVRAL